MTDQITRLLDQIDRLDQKSTPGKWVANEGTLKNREGWSIFVDEHNNTVTSATPGDAEFIALARTFAPAASRALRDVLETLGQYLAKYDQDALEDHIVHGIVQELRNKIHDQFRGAK